jgi:Na+-driven multidrug efflux pump
VRGQVHARPSKDDGYAVSYAVSHQTFAPGDYGEGSRMAALSMVAAGLIFLAWGAYLYRSSNVLERARKQPLGRREVFRIILEFVALGAIPEGLGLLIAGFARVLGDPVVALFAYIVSNLIVLALWLTRPNWAKPHWVRRPTARQAQP